MAKFRAILLRRWKLVVLTTLIGAVAGALSAPVGASRDITTYTVQQVVVKNRIPGNPADVVQDALKGDRGEVLERAARELREPERRLAALVTVRPDNESSSIQFEVMDTDPEYASRVVQVFTLTFLEVVNAELRQDLENQRTLLETRAAETAAALKAFDDANGFIQGSGGNLPQDVAIDALVAERNRLFNASAEAQRNLDDFILKAPGRVPYGTLGPEPPTIAESQFIEVPDSPVFRIGLLGTIGMLLGLALSLVVERVNPRIDSRDELAALISVPIIAEIGKIPRRERARGEGEGGRISLEGVWSEHYRRVRSAIEFVQADAATRVERAGEGAALNGVTVPDVAVISGHAAARGRIPRVFLFVSAQPGEGKSTSVTLTGMALAETGHETVVINADFRRPTLEKLVGTSPEVTLAEFAELSLDRPSIDEVVVPTDYPSLYLAASGAATTEVGPRILAAKEVAAEAAARGATVLIDNSPLRVSNDPIDMLSSADEVILVVRAGNTTTRSIEDTLELLAVHHAPVLGVILIGTLATREMYAYYNSYYDRAAKADQQKRADAKAAAEAADDASHDAEAAEPASHGAG